MSEMITIKNEETEISISDKEISVSAPEITLIRNLESSIIENNKGSV